MLVSLMLPRWGKGSYDTTLCHVDLRRTSLGIKGASFALGNLYYRQEPVTM